MRRKSNRNATKSTTETKTETRKSTRSTRRRKSPSVEPEASTTSANINESPSENSENPEDITSITPEGNRNQGNIIATSFEDEQKSEDDQGGHTPPRVKPTINEEPKKHEGDADKGKSKGISNSQVEENSEIQMNSVTTSSPEEAIKNEVNPDVSVCVKGNIDETSETQNVDKDLVSKGDVGADRKVSAKKTTVHKVSVDMVASDVEESEDVASDVKESENKVSADKVVEAEESDDKTGSQDKHEDSSVNSEVKACIETVNDENCASKIDSENVNSKCDKTETEQSNNNVEADEDQAEEGEIRESKSDEENDSFNKDSSKNKAKKTPMKIKLRRNSFFDAIEKSNETDDTPTTKKINWDSATHRCLKVSFQDLQRLDIEDFKSLSSDLKLAEEHEVKLEDIYQPRVIKERVKSMDTSGEEVERPDYLKQVSTASSDEQESTNIIALNRKISIVDDSASKLKPPPSPAKQPVSEILFISNLVRPFTLKQLKELLERTGTIKEDGFWTDRIKSKCYVWYESIEDAEATRNALHGVNWPVGNGKKLIIEYASEEQMEKAKNPPAQPTPQPVQTPPPRAKTPQKENTEPVQEQRNGERREERKRKDSERERERPKPPSTREWDVGKESSKERYRSRSRDRHTERRRKHSGKRSPTPLEDFIARKQRKLEESVPQKLMDDLFQRTKAMPCIYWQPLSPEEISVKQQQRLSRMEEHKRRLEENSRNRGVGARDRGSYRRRYD